ncbi:MAG: hypothetical protein KA524_04320 [Nitrosomonas sp.]|nr:hypothetical protein [Nitrosomonas sp.]MBP6075498.1 hypothetical protein [Nitrosomonas sp.]
MELWTNTSKKEKAFYVFAAFLVFYFVISNYVIIDRFKTSPVELFDSEIIEPKIILPEEKKNSFEKLSEELNLIEKDDVRYITIMMRDKLGQEKATIVYFPGGYYGVRHGEERNNESSLMEFGLQYLSGSNSASAHHVSCPSTHYLLQCNGMFASGTGHVAGANCQCVRIF